MADVNVWNGTAWKQSGLGEAYVWNGTAWTYPTLKYWDGNGWVKSVGITESALNSYTTLQYVPATAEFLLAANGMVLDAAASPLGSGRWIRSSSSAPTNYQAYVTVTSGTLDAGSASTGTWVNLDVNRSWTITIDNGSTSAVLSVKIRPTNGANCSTTTVTLVAESSYPFP